MFNKKEKCIISDLFANAFQAQEDYLPKQGQNASLNDVINTLKTPKIGLLNLNTDEIKLEEDLFLHKVILF